MANQKLHPLLAAIWLAGCGLDAPPQPQPLAVVAAPLATCSGDGAVGAVSEIQAIVQNSDGAITYDRRFGLGNSNFTVANVPEGPDEDVTLLGYSGGATPTWFARKRHVLVQSGIDNKVNAALTRFGGFSCPQGDNEYTHRMFPSITALGSGRFLIAGGLTSAVAGGVTRLVTSDSSRKAFVYDSATGSLVRAGGLMTMGRGAHAAVLVRGSSKNRVIFFGGTNAMVHDPASANGFAWSYDATDAILTAEVFEWSVGTDPATGEFVDFAGNLPDMVLKRVFPFAHLISNDGLVLVCGGGPWGVNDKPQGYIECDVWDTEANDFLLSTESNNFMAQYRAGAASVAFQQGEVTRLLILGGATEGPIAEVYTSSSNQRDGVGGSFVNKHIPGPPHSFFHSLTHVQGDQFVMIGGVNWNGLNFDPPSPDNAWRLTVLDDGSTVEVAAEAIPGLGVGRYFHAAGRPAPGRLAVVGGFTTNDLEPTADIRHLAAEGLIGAPASEAPFNPRGGMGFLLLDNDTLLLAGGISALADLQVDEAGALEVYTPSNLLPLQEN